MRRPKAATSPLDPSTTALLELFGGPLKDVSFPGVDAKLLEALVGEAHRASAAVDAAAAALTVAESQLAEHREALVAKTQLAIAYARVYAKDNAELLAQVDRIASPKRVVAAEASLGPRKRRQATVEPAAEAAAAE